MKLNIESLKRFSDAGFALPRYDIPAMRERTARAPKWLHFGAGNIFRALPAAALDQLLNEGEFQTGLVACEGFDPEIIDRAYRPFDLLSALITLEPSGRMGRRIIASVAEAWGILEPEGRMRLRTCFENPSLQMVSFTITEKGYAVRRADGQYIEGIARDLDGDIGESRCTLTFLTALLYARYRAGAGPLALVSMDNCSDNGDKLKDAVLDIARAFVSRGQGEDQWIDYLEMSVTYPLTMIDKITPRPDPGIAARLAEEGIEGFSPIETERHTHTAAFVNAEPAEYLVIEDRFPNGRPPLHRAGIRFCDRETVKKVERMKVTTCLNPLHTALAVLGCLLGIRTIHEEMEDPGLRAFVTRMAELEGLPVVEDPGIVDPRAFLDEVLNRRLPNPYLPDTPERIATDTSKKLAIRFGETIKAYCERQDLDVRALKYIPFALAAWLRYLTGVDDELNPFERSPDPLPEAFTDAAARFFDEGPEGARALLRREELFGVDLVEAGLDGVIIASLQKMLEGKGAVRRALCELLV